MTPVLIPLFVSAFRRAYALAMAMECRCYQGGDGRTRMKPLHLKKLDVFCIIFAALILAGVVLCDIFITPII
jgi:energy-coupling factor transport system permease protein